MKHGLLLIDKHAGGTSHDMVQQVRRVTRQKKVGHCGTLDPSATGLLLLTLGNATRLTRFLIRAPKVYEGTIRFGVTTDTYDAQGEATARADASAVTRAQVDEAMTRFTGTIEQTPPPYSAKKVQGKKLYELARKGEEVTVEAKEVTVYELVTTGELVDGEIAFRLACSSGTYARTLAHDVGRTVGSGGHLSSLRRIKIGDFDVAAAVSVAELSRRLEAARPKADPEAAPETNGGSSPREVSEPELAAAAGGAWIPFDEIPLPMDEVITDTQQEERLTHGQTALIKELPGEEGDWVKLMSRRRRFIAVGTVLERIGHGGVGIVQPRVVFK